MILASVLGIVFVVAGAAAYSGAWKGWITVRRGFGSTMGFASLWLGAAYCTGALATAAASARPLFFALLAVAALLLGVAVVGFFWLPPVLLPRWFRDLRGDAVRPRGRRGPHR